MSVFLALLVSPIVCLRVMNQWLPRRPPDEIARVSNNRYEIVAYLHYSGTDDYNNVCFFLVDKHDQELEEKFLWNGTRGGALASIDFIGLSQAKLVTYRKESLPMRDPRTEWRRGPSVDSAIVNLDEAR